MALLQNLSETFPSPYTFTFVLVHSFVKLCRFFVKGHLTPTFLSAKALPNCNFVKLPKLSPYTELLFAKLQNCLRIGRGVVAAWYMGIQISQKSRQHVKPAFSLPGSFHCRLYDSRNVSLCCCCDMAFSPTRKFDPYVEPSCYS